MTNNRSTTAHGVLSIRVLAARGLISPNGFGSEDLDSYVKFECDGKEYNTEVIRANNSPSYGEEFLLPGGYNPDGCLKLVVMEKYFSQGVEDEEIGRAKVPLIDGRHGESWIDWMELNTAEGEAVGAVCVSMHFRRLEPLALGPCASDALTPSLVPQQEEDVIDQTVAYLTGPRSRFLRYGYYYDLTKRVYRRAKRLPIISVTAPAYEYMMGGVLTVAMGRNNNPAEAVDHFVCRKLSALDEVIDATKDKALLAAKSLKDKVVHLSESMGPKEGEDNGMSEGPIGRVAALKGYLTWGASVARPMVSSLPIVGGVLRKTMDYVVPNSNSNSNDNNTTQAVIAAEGAGAEVVLEGSDVADLQAAKALDDHEGTQEAVPTN